MSAETTWRTWLEDNPAFAKRLTQFMSLHDAAQVLGELQPPYHETAAQYLREIADTVMRETGVGEDFLHAMIAGRPPLGAVFGEDGSP